MKKLIFFKSIFGMTIIFSIQASTAPPPQQFPSHSQFTNPTDRLRSEKPAKKIPEKQQAPSAPATPRPNPPPQQRFIENIPNPQSVIFTDPGVVQYIDGKWPGRDSLANLPTNIKVIAEIVTSKPENLKITEDKIADIVTSRLSQSGFTVNPNVLSKPLNPYLHVLVWVHYVQDKGAAILASIRLMEEVSLERVTFKDSLSYQAITWEKEILLISSIDAVEKRIQETITELSGEFVKLHQETFKQFQSGNPQEIE